MSHYILSASLLAANMACLGNEALSVLEAGADHIHFDVMDNHYVPNLTLGPDVCKALVSFGVNAPIDVHLMAKPVDDLIVKFAQAGASHITIHPESTLHLDRSLQLILDNGCTAGLALNPTTSPDVLKFCQNKISSVLVMLVNPGFGGQTLITAMYDKIKHVRKNHPNLDIQVDGGVNQTNIGELALCGATNFVAGSSIFNRSLSPIDSISALRKALRIT